MLFTEQVIDICPNQLSHSSLSQVIHEKMLVSIRDSADIQATLQTTVNEIVQYFKLDYCCIFWGIRETERLQIIGECNNFAENLSHIGEYSLTHWSNAANLFTDSERCNQLDQETGKAVISELTTCWQNAPQKQDLIKSCQTHVVIPVRGNPDRPGYLVCLASEWRNWTQSEIECLQFVAQSMELAIALSTSLNRKASLQSHAQLQQIAKREQLINQITSQTRSSLDLKTILTQAIAQLRLALEADRCLVHLVEDPEDIDPDNTISESPAETSDSVAFRRKHLYEVCDAALSPSIDDFDPHGPITEWVIENRQAVLISDVAKDARIGENNLEYQKAQIQSSLVIPVQTKNKLYGILYINQCSHLRDWSENDYELAQAVADQLAISIQQAYLYAQTRQQAVQSQAQAEKLAETLRKLQQTQTQLIQSEKLSSLGQMVAGIAHELNNPVSFIYGNVPYLESYVTDLLNLLEGYQQEHPHPSPHLQDIMEEIELDFLQRDFAQILHSMKAGSKRIQEIVQLLQNFSRLNQSPLKAVDLNAALDSALLILHNRIRDRIEIQRDYDTLPPVECYPKSINQVFLSVLMNGIESLERSAHADKRLTLRTKLLDSENDSPPRVQIAIADNGLGICPSIQSKIFDPFFTTKDIGQGRGLGLTVSYSTIVEQHQGQFAVNSQPQEGAEVIIEIPLKLRPVSNPASVSKGTPASLPERDLIK